MRPSGLPRNLAYGGLSILQTDKMLTKTEMTFAHLLRRLDSPIFRKREGMSRSAACRAPFRPMLSIMDRAQSGDAVWDQVAYLIHLEDNSLKVLAG